jgi:hypothetical protein
MLSLVEKRIQARRNAGSALARSLSTPHASSQYTSASAGAYSTTRRSDEKPTNEFPATATKTRYAGPRPIMITLPSSPSPQNTPGSAHRRNSSLGSTSPTANIPRLKSPQAAASPVEDLVPRSATIAAAGSEPDPDEHSLTSELSDLSDDPDFQRRVEERGQKRVILRELTTREENGDQLNEDEQALLSELRRAQEIETAAWSGGGHGIFEVGKIETTHWERYKERLRAEAMAAAEEHFRSDHEGGRYNEDSQDEEDPRNSGGSESGSEMGRRPSNGAPRRSLLPICVSLKYRSRGSLVETKTPRFARHTPTIDGRFSRRVLATVSIA